MTLNNSLRGISCAYPSLTPESSNDAFPMLATLTFQEGVLAGDSKTKGFENKFEILAYDFSLSRSTDSKGSTLHTMSNNGIRLIFPVNTTAKVSFFQALVLKTMVKKVQLQIVDMSKQTPTEQFEIDIQNALVVDCSFDSQFYLGAAFAVTLIGDTITLDDKISKKSTAYDTTTSVLAS